MPKTYDNSVSLHDFIKQHEGTIFSDGTLNMRHLLPKAYDLIKIYDLDKTSHTAKTICDDTLKCFKSTTEGEEVDAESSLFIQQYHSEIELKEESDIYNENGWHSSDLWEEFYDYMNSLAPHGYYFGGSEGDGACIGWFQYEIEEEEAEENELGESV